MRWSVLPLVAVLLMLSGGVASACTPDEYMSDEERALGPYDHSPPPWEANPTNAVAVQPVIADDVEPSPPREPDRAATEKQANTDGSGPRKAAPERVQAVQPVAQPSPETAPSPESAPAAPPPAAVAPPSAAAVERSAEPRRRTRASPAERRFRLPAVPPSAGRDHLVSAPPQAPASDVPLVGLALLVLIAGVSLAGLRILLMLRFRRARPLVPGDHVEAELQEIIAEARARELTDPDCELARPR